MLKPVLHKTWSALFLLTAMVASAQSPIPSQPVVATVDATKTGPPISPYIYGQFIEHAGDLIYRGLWSEMLEDRKFYFAVMPKPPEETNAPPRGEAGFGGPRRRGIGPGRWNPIGPVDSVVMDTNQPFTGDHTPLIRLAGSEPRQLHDRRESLVRRSNAEDAALRAGVDTLAQVEAVNFGALSRILDHRRAPVQMPFSMR